MQLDDRYILSLVAMVLCYLALHWFRWWRRLRRLEAYTIGVGTLFAAIAIWMGLTRQFLLLCAYPVAAGLSVGFSYLADLVAHWRARAESGIAASRAANSAASREVRTLEDASFTLSGALSDLDIVAMRIAQRARTQAECADLEAIVSVKVRLEDTRGFLQHLHPDRLPSTR